MIRTALKRGTGAVEIDNKKNCKSKSKIGDKIVEKDFLFKNMDMGSYKLYATSCTLCSEMKICEYMCILIPSGTP